MFSVTVLIHSGFSLESENCHRAKFLVLSLLQTLDSILNVEMVKEKSAEEIKQVMDLNEIKFTVKHRCGAIYM